MAFDKRWQKEGINTPSRDMTSKASGQLSICFGGLSIPGCADSIIIKACLSHAFSAQTMPSFAQFWKTFWRQKRIEALVKLK